MAEATELRLRARMVVVVGRPGVGKSTVANRLARRLGMNYVETDEHLQGDLRTINAMPREQRREHFTRAYRSAHEEAARILQRGDSVVLDGSYLFPERRSAARDMAAGLSIAPVILDLHDDEGASARDDARPPERKVGRHDEYRSLDGEMLEALPGEQWPTRVRLEFRDGRWHADAPHAAWELAGVALNAAASLPTAAALGSRLRQ